MRKHPLRRWREDQGLSRTELAAKVGVTAEAVRQWEEKNQAPHAVHIRALVKLTQGQVRADELLGV